MGFSREEREKVLAVHLFGLKTPAYLELIGFSRFQDLVGRRTAIPIGVATFYRERA